MTEDEMLGWVDGITDLMDISLCKLQGVDDVQESVACCNP